MIYLLYVYITLLVHLISYLFNETFISMVGINWFDIFSLFNNLISDLFKETFISMVSINWFFIFSLFSYLISDLFKEICISMVSFNFCDIFTLNNNLISDILKETSISTDGINLLDEGWYKLILKKDKYKDMTYFFMLNETSTNGLSNNLFMLNETFTNGFSYNFLNVISFASVICGLLVITSKNPIVSVLFLIGLFFNIAGYLMMLGINFIGLSYLLVYVGAVSILFLFILMLINVRISELVTDNNNGVPLAIMIGIVFNLVLYKLLPSNSSANEYSFAINNMDFNNVNAHTLLSNDSNSISYALNNIFTLNNNDLLFVSSQIWDGVLAETTHITSIGNIIYTAYPIWLILTSLILLLAMVGAIVITIKQ